jgi:hypothetical protein
MVLFVFSGIEKLEITNENNSKEINRKMLADN